MHALIVCDAGEIAADGDEVYRCSFTPPDHCNIVTATETLLNGPAGESLEVIIAADGTRVTSTVTALPAARANGGKVSRPEISLTARIKCRRS